MYKTALLGLLASSPVSAQLNSLAQAAGLQYFGTTVDNGYLSDEAYKALADDTEEFGQLVPENGQKWDSTEPSNGQFSYEKADVVPDLAKKNGQILRCHALTWHSQLPSWVSGGSFSKEELTTIIEAHISNVVGHYKGDCYAWDVVNEAIGDDGNWRDSVFYQTLGTDYLAISFNAARKADPDAKLYYNDYNLEGNGAKTERALELVKIVQDAGAPIDGVGFQGHLIVGQTPSRSNLATVLKRFTAINVEVAYTELDIRHSSVPASESALKTQGDDFANVVGSCLDVEGCVGVTVWGVSDKYSWVPDTFSGAGEALIYNDQYEKKPAWTSISSLLAAAATGSSKASSVEASSVVATAEATSVEATSVVATAEATSVEATSVVATAEATSVAPIVETAAPATTLETRTKPAVSISEAVSAPEPTSLIVTPFLNNTATQTTLEIRTSAAAPIASAVNGDDEYEGDEDCEEEGEEAGEDAGEDEDYEDDEDCEDEEEQPEPFPTYAVPGNSTTPINGTVPYNSQAPVSEAAAASVTESPTVRVPIIRHSSSAYYPWNTQPAASNPSVPAPTGTAPSAPIGTGTTELVKHYYQCGGRNWDGPTQCEEPYVCEEHNEWYHQCV